MNAEEYINKELENSKTELFNIEKDIHSCEIEIQTIKKKHKQYNSDDDFTENILHSVTENHNPEADNKLFHKVLEEVEAKKNQLLLIRDNIQDKITELENVLASSKSLENVSCETINEDSLNLLRIDEINKQKLSRDIHDSIIQNLTALIHKQEFINQLMNKDINRAKIEINNSKVVIRDIIDELRCLISDLRPMSFDDLGFSTSFMDTCEYIKNQSDSVIVNYNIKSEIELDANNIKIDPVIGINIIRIIRELSSNSFKHAECDSINIELIYRNNEIIINYSDNGIGFDFDNCVINKETNSGYGMVMLKERISILNGRINYNNNEGSNFIIEIPIIYNNVND